MTNGNTLAPGPAPLGAVCGCGAPARYRVRMTDKLWTELFSTPALRPAHVDLCGGDCLTEAQRWATPLEGVTA